MNNAVLNDNLHVNDDTTSPVAKPVTEPITEIDEVDRKIIIATQQGLPLDPRPYEVVAIELGLSSEEVIQRMRKMLKAGIIRRIGAVPNHYALGYKANGMTVWNVPDSRIAALGQTIGALSYVSHCYQRPRYLPEWPYNLFAMVHGNNRNEVTRLAQNIARLLGNDNMGYDVLFSTRILKKSGLRLLN